MHCLKVETCGFQSFLHHAENHLHVVDAVKDRFLVFLQVAAVAKRSALHERVECGEVSEHAARLSADKFHGVRILLLRHHRRTAGECIVQGEVAKFARAPVHKVFGITAHRVRDDGEVGVEFEHHVAMAYSINAVRAHVLETECFSNECAVVRECRTCHSATAKRELAMQFQEVVETLHVTAHGKEHAHEVMAKVNRLCLLQVRIARHHLAKVLLGKVQNRFHKFNFELADFCSAVTHVKLEVRADLVIAATARVDLLAECANAFGEHAFHSHVDVFVAIAPEVFAGVVVIENALEAVANLLVVCFRKNARFHETLAMSDASFDIFFDEFCIKLQAET